MIIRLFFVVLGDQSLGGEDHRSHAAGVLQGGASDLGRVDDALGDHVSVVVVLGVVPVVGGVVVADFFQNHGGFVPRVAGDDPDGRFQSLFQDGLAHVFVVGQGQ